MPLEWQYNADQAFRSWKVQNMIKDLSHEERMEVWRAFRHSYVTGVLKIGDIRKRKAVILS